MEQLELFGDAPLGPVWPVYEGRLRDSPLYMVWVNMRQRCENEGYHHFHNYGGRGITVCAQWRENARGFMGWALWNGYAKGLQLDRIDNDGPYSPDNCRFVTASRNQRNRRDTVRLADGRVCADVADESGVSVKLARWRRGRGWSAERAATEPGKPRPKRGKP